MRVRTASGRVYEIDLDGRRFRTMGDQDFGLMTPLGTVPIPDPHHEWTEFAHLDVDDGGRLYIVERGGEWRKSTRVVEGLVELVAALDGTGATP